MTRDAFAVMRALQRISDVFMQIVSRSASVVAVRAAEGRHLIGHFP